MPDEILINACESDEVVIYDEEGSEEVLLSAEGIVIIGSGSGGGNADTLGGQSGGYYRSRANHTGTQPAATIAGLAAVATSGSYNDLGDKPTISTNALTLQGQNGAYYLGRGHHTGTQAISTVTGLQAALNLKLDAADYNDRFLGLYASVFDLETAHPTAAAGDYAQVDWGIGTDVIVYVYDVSDAQWIPVGSSSIANTDALPEGSSNLYHTTQRVRDTPLTGLSTATATAITAADSVLSAAGKLQSQASANATAIAGKLSTADAPAAVRGTALTGLSTATAAPITAADTVLTAAGKLQAQISAAGGGGVAARRMPVGFWQTASGVATAGNMNLSANTIAHTYFYLPAQITISDVSINAAAAVAGGQVKLRFYDLVTRAAVSPEYTILAPNAGLNILTLPSPLTLPSGNYFFGLLSNSVTSRQIAGISTGQTAFPVTSGASPPYFAQGMLSFALPATAAFEGAANGAQPNINFFVSA